MSCYTQDGGLLTPNVSERLTQLRNAQHNIALARSGILYHESAVLLSSPVPSLEGTTTRVVDPVVLKGMMGARKGLVREISSQKDLSKDLKDKEKQLRQGARRWGKLAVQFVRNDMEPIYAQSEEAKRRNEPPQEIDIDYLNGMGHAVSTLLDDIEKTSTDLNSLAKACSR